MVYRLERSVMMMSWRTFRFARASHALATRPRVKISMFANTLRHSESSEACASTDYLY